MLTLLCALCVGCKRPHTHTTTSHTQVPGLRLRYLGLEFSGWGPCPRRLCLRHPSSCCTGWGGLGVGLGGLCLRFTVVLSRPCRLPRLAAAPVPRRRFCLQGIRGPGPCNKKPVIVKIYQTQASLGHFSASKRASLQWRASENFSATKGPRSGAGWGRAAAAAAPNPEALNPKPSAEGRRGAPSARTLSLRPEP